MKAKITPSSALTELRSSLNDLRIEERLVELQTMLEQWCDFVQNSPSTDNDRKLRRETEKDLASHYLVDKLSSDTQTIKTSNVVDTSVYSSAAGLNVSLHNIFISLSHWGTLGNLLSFISNTPEFSLFDHLPKMESLGKTIEFQQKMLDLNEKDWGHYKASIKTDRETLQSLVQEHGTPDPSTAKFSDNLTKQQLTSHISNLVSDLNSLIPLIDDAKKTVEADVALAKSICIKKSSAGHFHILPEKTYKKETQSDSRHRMQERRDDIKAKFGDNILCKITSHNGDPVITVHARKNTDADKFFSSISESQNLQQSQSR